MPSPISQLQSSLKHTADPSQAAGDNEVLVKVENVSKRFCRDLKRSLGYGVRDVATEALGISKPSHDLRKDEFWAVNDVSFELRRGECLGLIGRNGAGKTTLLKMLNGLIKPDRGRIEMRGRVGALIALGAGFNPLLTGRENVFINGSVLGLTKKEIDEKFDEIVAFAELEQFIDAPVQSYSSGMQVRLGFSVAAVLVKPDVLLLDEVLAVGDVGFRTKCYNSIDLLRQSAAVILVSHSLEHISRVTGTTLVLRSGKPIYLGPTDTGLQVYRREFSNQAVTSLENHLFPPLAEVVSGKEEMVINSGSSLSLEIKVRALKSYKGSMRFALSDEGFRVCAEMRFPESEMITFEKGWNTLRLNIPSLDVMSGTYTLHVNWYAEESRLLGTSSYLARVKVDGSGLGEVAYCPKFSVQARKELLS